MNFFNRHENLLAFLLIGLALAFSAGLTLWIRIRHNPIWTIGVCSALGAVSGAAFGNWLDEYAQKRAKRR